MIYINLKNYFLFFETWKKNQLFNKYDFKPSYWSISIETLGLFMTASIWGGRVCFSSITSSTTSKNFVGWAVSKNTQWDSGCCFKIATELCSTRVDSFWPSWLTGQVRMVSTATPLAGPPLAWVAWLNSEDYPGVIGTEGVGQQDNDQNGMLKLWWAVRLSGMAAQRWPTQVLE